MGNYEENSMIASRSYSGSVQKLIVEDAWSRQANGGEGRGIARSGSGCKAATFREEPVFLRPRKSFAPLTKKIAQHPIEK
jgi:hypothetical protein